MSSEDSDATSADITFADLQIHPAVLQALADVGYESPSAIQAATIPAMMAATLRMIPSPSRYGPGL